MNVSNSNEAQTSEFKWHLFEHFAIESSRYESEWEYEEYVRLAEPAYERVACPHRWKDKDAGIHHFA